MAEPKLIEKIYENTWRIVDGGLDGSTTNIYLLAGEKKALVIDTGYGLLKLSEIIPDILQENGFSYGENMQGVLCACTHGHIDHAMGTWMFPEWYLRPEDNELYWDTTKHWLKRKYTEPIPIADGQIFDLGKRVIRTYRIPGHTKGSVAFIDENSRIIYDGDAASKEMWLHLPEACDKEEYLRILQDYRQFLVNSGISVRRTGHWDTEIGISDLDELISCTELAIDHPERHEYHQDQNGEAWIYRYKGEQLWTRPEEQ